MCLYAGGKCPKSDFLKYIPFICHSHVHVHLGALILRCSTPFNLMYIIRYDIYHSNNYSSNTVTRVTALLIVVL